MAVVVRLPRIERPAFEQERATVAGGVHFDTSLTEDLPLADRLAEAVAFHRTAVVLQFKNKAGASR